MIIKHSEITMIKMSVNPPQCVIDADYCVIANGKVMQYVGIGWTEIRDATPSDYERIPQILTPHCSHCQHYDILANATMYCHKQQKRIRLASVRVKITPKDEKATHFSRGRYLRSQSPDLAS